VDPQQFSPAKRESSGPPVLIHVSNLRPIKRVHDVVAIADGETGILLPPGDVAAMAESATRLLTDDVLWADMSRLAHRRARTCFALDRAADRYEANYRRVLG
jgi:hypothetical protein